MELPAKPTEPPVSEEPPPLEVEVLTPIFEVTTFLPGRLPGFTLVVTFVSVALSLAAHKEHTAVHDWLYSDTVSLWFHYHWWSLVGSAFIHGGFLHLIFNCYWIWILGRLLERELGAVRTLALFVTTAWFSGALELACSGQLGIGLSGVVYGYLGFLLGARARHPDFVRMTNRHAVLLILWMIVCFPLTYSGALNISNFGHVGGFIAGGVIGLASYPGRWRITARGLSVVLLALSFVPLCWAPWLGDWAIVKASQALRAQDDETALAALAEVRRAHPDYDWALENELLLRMKRHEYALADELMKNGASALPSESYNNIAWVLATHPDAKVRDGARAVEMGRKACTLDDWRNVMYLDTLAAAHAEAGDFDEAVKMMLRVMEKPDGKDALYQSHLDAFRAHKPWREDPPS